MPIMHRALVVLSLAFLACDGPSATQHPTGPTTTTEFKISVMNACSDDLLIKLAQSPQEAGRQQILNKKMRDTITGTNERVYILAGDEVVTTYTPVQGDQRATISADCTAMTRE